MPVQWHALALGLFASIIVPFGGFFASGFKGHSNLRCLLFLGSHIGEIFHSWKIILTSVRTFFRILETAYPAMVDLLIGWTAK
jgi:hypothetical protein